MQESYRQDQRSQKSEFDMVIFALMGSIRERVQFKSRGNPSVRVVKWAKNQIGLVAKLRTPFQIQIMLVAIAKSCEKLRFSHFGLENHSKT